MKAKLVALFGTMFVFLGVPYSYATKAERLAENHADGPFCWVLQGADGGQDNGHIRLLRLSSSQPSMLQFWTHAALSLTNGGDTLPHFAIAIPTPKTPGSSRILGWSYKTGAYYDLSEKASVLGIFWFADDCATFLTTKHAEMMNWQME